MDSGQLRINEEDRAIAELFIGGKFCNRDRQSVDLEKNSHTILINKWGSKFIDVTLILPHRLYCYKIWSG